MIQKDCGAGCQIFTGGEIKHHKGCPHYEQSFTQMYDNNLKELEAFRAKEQNSIEEEFYVCRDWFGQQLIWTWTLSKKKKDCIELALGNSVQSWRKFSYQQKCQIIKTKVRIQL